MSCCWSNQAVKGGGLKTHSLVVHQFKSDLQHKFIHFVEKVEKGSKVFKFIAFNRWW